MRLAHHQRAKHLCAIRLRRVHREARQRRMALNGYVPPPPEEEPVLRSAPGKASALFLRMLGGRVA